MRGVQCLKSLYLYKYHYDLQDKISDSQQVIFDQGWDVGTLAQKLFPGGVNIRMDSGRDYSQAVRRTCELISEGHTIIYEAALEAHGVFCAVDILVRGSDGWRIYEVKSSTEVKDEHVLDAAVQYWIASQFTPSPAPSPTRVGEIVDVSIVFIDNEYVRQGEIEVEKLFQVESVFERVEELQEFVEEKLTAEVAVLRTKEMPEVEIGPHCGSTYSCSFTGYCWKHVPEDSIFNIRRLNGEKKWELYNQGNLTYERVPDVFPLNDKQWLQVEIHRQEGVIHIEREKIRNFVQELEYPLWFLDFETINPAIPLFDGTRPYEQVPFQYSLHVIESSEVARWRGSEIKHYSFLGTPPVDPRRGFVESLLDFLGKDGSVIAWNMAFEQTRLKEISCAFPEYASRIQLLIDRFIDLMIPFQKMWYYDKRMQGSYSIKAVLPVLCPELSYEELEVGDGGTASNYFIQLMQEKDDEKIKSMRNALLEYCKLDTWAMVKVLQVLMRNK